jgi:hypothetical protein
VHSDEQGAPRPSGDDRGRRGDIAFDDTDDELEPEDAYDADALRAARRAAATAGDDADFDDVEDGEGGSTAAPTFDAGDSGDDEEEEEDESDVDDRVAPEDLDLDEDASPAHADEEDSGEGSDSEVEDDDDVLGMDGMDGLEAASDEDESDADSDDDDAEEIAFKVRAPAADAARGFASKARDLYRPTPPAGVGDAADVSGESNADDDDDESDDGESDDGEMQAEEGEVGPLKWKDNMAERASDAYFRRKKANLHQYIYGGAAIEGLDSESDDEDDSDGSGSDGTDSDDGEGGSLFKVKKTEAKVAEVDSSRAALLDATVADWSNGDVMDKIRNRFVTGTWQEGEGDAATLLAEHDAAGEAMYGDFEDLEAEPKEAADGAVTTGDAGAAGAEGGEPAFNAGDGEEDDAETQAAAEDALAEKKKAKRAAFNAMHDNKGGCGARFSAGICTRGCHWLHGCSFEALACVYDQCHVSRISTTTYRYHCKLYHNSQGRVKKRMTSTQRQWRSRVRNSSLTSLSSKTWRMRSECSMKGFDQACKDHSKPQAYHP